MKNKYLYKISFKRIVLVTLFLLFSFFLFAQTDTINSDSINKKRLNTIIYGSIGTYSTSLIVLYFAWYKDSSGYPFHFHDDKGYWLGADKLGHLTTAYTISNYGYWALRWAGVNEIKSTVYGGVMGFGALTVIEILDGFTEYGASWSDLTANTIGTGVFIGQQFLWKEQRIRLKFSYHSTEYAKYRPDKLGETYFQRVLKDYNGQTFWLSANIHSFLKKESKFPSWINVSVGYGGKGMLGETSNPEYDNNGNPIPHFDRVRQYYVSMDIDWTRIKTNSNFLKFLFKGLSFVKLPFPTLEYNKENQFVFHWLYF